MNDLDPWFLENLVCPVDGGSLRWEPEKSCLHSMAGCVYPVVDGVPIMLPPEVEPTLSDMNASRYYDAAEAPWYLSSVLLSDEEKEGIRQLSEKPGAVDPVAAYLVAATNGIGYAHLVGNLRQYPIPEIRLPQGDGETLLDVGCSWGRWCIAAARKGYSAIGMDPSLGAIMAARRVARQLNVECRFFVGDARHLPLRDECVERAFSYSVLQHLSPEDANQSIRHLGRVLRPGGFCLVQMPGKWGLRCLMNQAKRRFREAVGFEVRYWSLADLREVFENSVGVSTPSVDCFFGIGWQPSDLQMMPLRLRLVIYASETLRRMSSVIPALTKVADSVYVHATKSTK
ncbi:MAG: methyltransferase domain-containing protein [Verrucomicrobiales bacterium]